MLLKLGRMGVLLALATFVLTGSVSLYAADEPSAKEHDKAGEHEQDAGGHGGHSDPEGTPTLLQFDLGSAICNILIFLGVFAVLAKFVWPVILDGLKAREEKIHGDLAAAETAKTDAEKLKAEFQTQLNEAQSEVQSMLAQARKDAEASGQKIVEQAKAEAAQQAERAIAEIEIAKKVAVSELAGQTSDMAIGVAKQIVGRELKAGDHQDLIRQSLDSLPSNN